MPAKKATNHMALWNAVEKTDPAFTKNITGRQYKGTSPNVTYLIQKATEQLGPAGHGFGWTVMDERIILGEKYENGTEEKLHCIRIQFWTRDPETGEIGHFDSIGQTRMGYMTAPKPNRPARYILDEDGPKKSLTDAITKAMSQLGFAADIFLGRYDDNKYVAELREEFGNSSDSPAQPDAPKGAAGQTAGGGADDDW